MARESSEERKDGVTIGDVRRWLDEANMPDNAILSGKLTMRGIVTKLTAREDRLKDDRDPDRAG